jgi:hypothetical protein
MSDRLQTQRFELKFQIDEALACTVRQHVRAFDVKSEYVRMVIFRSNGRGGPWALRHSGPPLDGTYLDPAPNGETLVYRILAVDDEEHWSAVRESEPTTPREDPVPPEARLLRRP